MPISVQCPQCAKQFNAKEELAGKRVKCSQCGTVIAIPGGAAAAPKPGTPPRPPAAAAPRRAPAPASAAPAGSSILDMLSDSKLGELKEMPVVRQGEMLCTSCQAVLPMGAAVCTKCGFDFRDGKTIGFVEEKSMSPRTKALLWALATSVLIMICVTGALTLLYFCAWGIPSDLAGMEKQMKEEAAAAGVPVTSIAPPRWYNFLQKTQKDLRNLSIVILMMGGALAVLNGFSMLADAFTERPIYGWLFFLPPFALYYIATRWKLCRKLFMTWTIGTCIMSVGIYMLRQSLAYEAAHPVLEKGKFK